MCDIAEPAQFTGPSGGLKSFGHSSFSTPGELFFLPSSASFPPMGLSPCNCPQLEGAALFQHINGFECPSSGPATQCPTHPRKAPHCFLPETPVAPLTPGQGCLDYIQCSPPAYLWTPCFIPPFLEIPNLFRGAHLHLHKVT